MARFQGIPLEAAPIEQGPSFATPAAPRAPRFRGVPLESPQPAAAPVAAAPPPAPPIPTEFPELNPATPLPPRIGPLTHDGFPVRKNPDGSHSSELSITVTDPRLNGGRPTNIPSLWQGREVDDDTAVQNALRSGKPYPSFGSIPEAVQAAGARSDAGGASAPPASPSLASQTMRFAKDAGASVVAGAGSIMQFPGQAYGLATGDFDTMSTRGGESVRQFGQSLKSPELQEKERQAQAIIAEAEKDGFGAEVGAVLKTYLSDPVLLANFTVEQLPSLLATMGFGKLAQWGTQVAARVAQRGAVSAGTLSRAGQAGAITGGAAMQGASVGDETRDAILRLPDDTFAASPAFQALVASGIDPQAAKEQLALEGARLAGAAGAGISGATATLLPGVERMGFGQASTQGIIRRVLTGGAAEGFQEGLEEGGGRFAQNVAVQQIDPNQSLIQGVGAQGTMGALPGAVTGAGVAALSGGNEAAAPQPAAPAAPQERIEPTFAAPTQPPPPPNPRAEPRFGTGDTVLQPAPLSTPRPRSALAADMADPRPIAEIDAERQQKAREQQVELASQYGYPPIGSAFTFTMPDGESLQGVMEGVQQTSSEGLARIRGADGQMYVLGADEFTVTEGTGEKADPVVVKTAKDVDVAAQQVVAPTPAQAKAGNYKHAHVEWEGFDIAIETPQGGTRSGVGKDGKPWSVTMPHHYGRLKGTIGADGDQLDITIGPNPEQNTVVWVIDQIDADTGKFDEHKIMAGFEMGEEAEQAYIDGFSDGRGMDRIGAVQRMDLAQLRQWIANGNTKKALSYDGTPKYREYRIPAPAQAPGDNYRGGQRGPAFDLPASQPAPAAEPPQGPAEGAPPRESGAAASPEPAPAPVAPAAAAPQRNGHFAAGEKAAQENQPRELPSYFTDRKGVNARMWFKGYDSVRPAKAPEPKAAPPAAPQKAPEPVTFEVKSLETGQTSELTVPANPPARNLDMDRAAFKGALEKTGAARYGGADYVIAEGPSGGFYFRRTKDGNRIEKGAGYPGKWAREEAIRRATLEAFSGAPQDSAPSSGVRPLRPNVSGDDASYRAAQIAIEQMSRRGYTLTRNDASALSSSRYLDFSHPTGFPISKRGRAGFYAALGYTPSNMTNTKHFEMRIADHANVSGRSSPTWTWHLTKTDAENIARLNHLLDTMASWSKTHPSGSDGAAQPPVIDDRERQRQENVRKMAEFEAEKAAEQAAPSPKPAEPDMLPAQAENEDVVQPSAIPAGDAGPVARADEGTAPERADGETSGRQGTRARSEREGSAGERGPAGREPRPDDSGTGASGDVRLPDSAVADKRPDADVKGENHVIEPSALGEARPWRQKALDNIRAIELMRQIEAEGRPATKAEQAELARYVGWGGIRNAFPDAQGAYGKGFETIGKKLRELLSDTEYKTAQRSIQYAHYTSETIVREMWRAAQQLGFKGGKVFEPGMGVGNFAGMMPTDVAAASTYHGLELDHTTARIARLLYPRFGIRQDDFTKAPIPADTYDLAIGNPPFADVAIKSDPAYAKHSFLLHDYFFAKSLDAVRPGGLLMFVTSAGTLNKIDTSAREYMADRADFVGAIRLPGDAFEKNAGTSVTTDIIILRKRLPGETAGSTAWTETVERTLPNKDGAKQSGAVNRWISENPEMVLGDEGFFDKLYPGRYGVRSSEGDFAPKLKKAVDSLPADVLTPWQETQAERAEVDFGTKERKDGSFYLDASGRLMQMRDRVGQPVPQRGKGATGGKTGAELARIKKLIPIRDALRAVLDADLSEDTGNAAKARKRLNAAYDDFVAEFGPINKAELTERRPNVIQQESARSEAREEARFNGLPFDEGTFNPRRMIAEGKSLSEIARARNAMREEYAKEGKAFDEGTFSPDDMPDIIIDKRPNVDAFMDDPESYRLRAIEDYNDNTGEAKKRPIFERNIITREKEPEIKSVNDALLYVLNRRGRVAIDEIAAAVNLTVPQAIEQLGDKIFKLPGAQDAYETRDAYLSGNVRKKLLEAQAAAERNAEFRANVEALEAVQPTPLPPSEISANLGMPWLPTDVIEAFGKDIGLTSLRVKYLPALATWTVSGDDSSSAATTEWGTPEMAAPDLISDALNRQDPKIYDEVRNPDGSKSRVLNTTATQAAQDKLQAIKAKFSEWVWSDPARADRLSGIYNENYNNLVVREYDGAYLTTPGIAAGWSWRPHQTRAIARIIQSGNTYLAHAVGAGKTSEMIGAIMEQRRLGLVRKPMVAVPNHMLGQFTKEFYEQYPTAKIAVADERRFHTDRRKQFVADVANDDLDAIIITHSAMGLIPVSPEFQDGLIQEQIDQFRELMAELDKSDRITRRRIENAIERLEQRLLGKAKKQDQVYTFEQMGVDQLFVDEAHLFRKLDFATRMSNVKGISPEGSKSAFDLYVKSRYLETINPGRSLVLASGTPVTNTMAELYTVSRYLQAGELAERGLSHFDAWAAAFGDMASELEQDAAGGYKPVTRFAQFVNIPELSAMVRQQMDVVTFNQLEQYVVRPKIKGGRRQLHMAEKSPELVAYQEELANRMKAIANRRGPPKPGDDIILSVINDGRHAAIDMRLVNPDLPSDPNSKLNQMIDRVFDIWQRTKRQPFHKAENGKYADKPFDYGPATQMIFANLGIGGSRPFNVHTFIVNELARRGVPRAEIAQIADFKTHVAKQRLFNDMNEGKVRVLIGSTAKMATGVNAQKRLYTVHNLDPLWYPADDEQRNGRVLRQGNMNPEIEINDYSTKGTYDSTMWGMMARKAGFIQGFFEGDKSIRSIEDLGEASLYEQAKALTTNDPRLIQLTEVKQELEKARRRRSAFESEIWSVKEKLASARRSIEYAKSRIPEVKKDIAQRIDTKGDLFKGTVDRKKFDERAEFGAAVLAKIEEIAKADKPQRGVKIAEIGGFPLMASSQKAWGGKEGDPWSVSLYIDRNGDFQTDITASESALGIVRSLEHALGTFENNLGGYETNIERGERTITDFTPKLDKKFEGDAKIKELAEKLAGLEADINADAKAREAAAAAQKAATQAEDQAADDGEEMNSLRTTGRARNGEKVKLGAPIVDRKLDTLRAELYADLREELDRIGLTDVALNLPDYIARGDGEGGVQYSAGRQRFWGDATVLIEIALTEANGVEVQVDPQSTLHHEAVHAMKRLNLFSPAEWKVLSAKSLSTWVKEFGLTDKDSGYKTLPKNLILEEGIARAYEAWKEGQAGAVKGGLIARAFAKIKRFIEAIGNAFRGRGFNTVEGLFEKIDEGTIGRRGRTANRADADGPRKNFKPMYADIEGDAMYSLLPKDQAAPAESERMAELAGEEIVSGADRDFVKDTAQWKRLIVHPRTIAAYDKHFVPVYRAAVRQFETRDEYVAAIASRAKAYTDLPPKDRAQVDKVIELGRLEGTVYGEAALREGVTNDPDANEGRTKDAQLTRPGETVTLTDRQIEGYRAVRASMDKALDLFKAQMIEEWGYDPTEIRSSADILALITDETSDSEAEQHKDAAKIIREIEQAQRTGYVPFSRWGQIGIAVRRADSRQMALGIEGEATRPYTTIHYEMVEVDGAISRLMRLGRRLKNRKTTDTLREFPEVKARLDALKAKYDFDPDVRISVFQVGEGGPLEQGVKLSDLDMLAEVARIDDKSWEQVREQLEKAIKMRGFRKHFFGSKNMPGYSVDFERAIADYTIGIAGYLARRKYGSIWDSAIGKIPSTKPKLRDYAQKYRDYTQSPQEELQMLRQLGFVFYLTAPASALVNTTQVPLVTVPWLTQFAPVPKVMYHVGRAYKDALAMTTASKGMDVFDPAKAPEDVREAFQKAWDEGFFVPLNTWEMMGTAQNRSQVVRRLSKAGRTAVDAVALGFTVAERLNRIVTWIAAYRLGRQDTVRQSARTILADNALARSDELLRGYTPEKFAGFAIDETQLRMGKVNRPEILRGYGSAVLQFKGYFMQIVELQFRQIQQYAGPRPKLAVGAMWLLLLLTAGIWGAPFGDDLKDILEWINRKFGGTDLDLDTEFREFVVELTGSPALAEALSRGAPRAAGVDLQRIGMGNFLPSDAQELGGIPLDLAWGRLSQAIEHGKRGNWMLALSEMMPAFLKGPMVAASWADDGVRSQASGRRVIEPEQVSTGDVVLKGLGFTPADIANKRETERAKSRANTAVKEVKDRYIGELARLRADILRADNANDAAKSKALEERFARTLDEIRAFNEGRPLHEMVIVNPQTLKDRVREELTGAAVRDKNAPKQARPRREEIERIYGER